MGTRLFRIRVVKSPILKDTFEASQHFVEIWEIGVKLTYHVEP